jgi:hypothetical protein
MNLPKASEPGSLTLGRGPINTKNPRWGPGGPLSRRRQPSQRGTDDSQQSKVSFRPQAPAETRRGVLPRAPLPRGRRRPPAINSGVTLLSYPDPLLLLRATGRGLCSAPPPAPPPRGRPPPRHVDRSSPDRRRMQVLISSPPPQLPLHQLHGCLRVFCVSASARFAIRSSSSSGVHGELIW